MLHRPGFNSPRNRSELIRIPVPIVGADMRLVCFPHEGAGASTYFRWIKTLQKFSIEVASILNPGREDRLNEDLKGSLNDLVDEIAEHWKSITDGKKIAVFGHSMGALIAFTLIKKMVLGGCSGLPTVLYITGKNPPHLVRKYSPIAHLPRVEFINAIEERYGALPAEVVTDPEMMEIIVQILRQDIFMVENHPAEPPIALSMPLHIFGGADDESTSRADLAEWTRYSKSVKITFFPGGHFFHREDETGILEAIVRDIKARCL